jgi:hypothetical protein
VSFLDQLKSQANALQSHAGIEQRGLEENTARTEAACKLVHHYLDDLARQLNVIQPPAARFTLDGRTPWPAMKLTEFRVDARRKLLRGREAFDYVAMGWRVVPQAGQAVTGIVRVNFPPDLQRVESRLMMGPVKHERRELRHPDKNTLQAIEFEYLTETRGSIAVTPDHDRGAVGFRVLNGSGFGVLERAWPASEVTHDLLDELAKLVVGQPNRFA